MKHIISFVFLCFYDSAPKFFFSIFVFQRSKFFVRRSKRKSLSDCKIF